MNPFTENLCTSNSSYNQWNIYIARGILKKSPGVLVGSVSWSTRTITVLGTSNSMHRSADRTVGHWFGGNKEAFDAVVRHYECMGDDQNQQFSFLHLYRDLANHINCRLSVPSQSNEIPPVCIVFEPQDILNSYIFMSSKHFPPCAEFENSSHSVNKHSFSNSSVVGENIAYILQEFLLKECVFSDKLVIKKPEISFVARLLKQTVSFFPLIVMSMFASIHGIFYLRFPRLKTFLSLPSFSSHLIARCRRSHHMLNMDEKDSVQSFIKYNAYSQHILETLIGMSILYYVVSNNLPDLATSCLLDWAEDVAGNLNELIKWLMGAPAGLKLNSQLTSMLGHFFIYHIYLWTGYLSILRTALPWLLVFASWAGVLGVSFQLCMVQDILSMLTLHIYCFYVYAARSFYLQTSALASLWRLFRGKKWNSLRSRVDSATYNTDQLFVGTLFFTVLLFLLPTTALYYAVFTALRIATLVVQAVLSLLIHYVSITPVYSLLLYLVRPQRIAGTVEFDIVHASEPPSSLVLILKTAKLPLDKLVSLTTPHLAEVQESHHSWSELLTCLLTGKIIFPWVQTMETGNGSAEKTKED